MADGQSMTTTELVRRTLLEEHGDFLKEAVALVAAQLMDAEISAEIGAELGEVAPGSRSTHRNGYRPRPWETRVGEIELLVPRKRSGSSYFPSFLEPRRRSEQAIIAVVLEAYVNGVSTRKVDRLVEQLGIDGMTKDRVSAICRGLDEQVELFRGRPLEGAYPYLWVDAKHVKVRRPRPGGVKGGGGRLCGARDGGQGGDRRGCRRGGVWRVLDRVPALAQAARA
jgi:transposase-like protein